MGNAYDPSETVSYFIWGGLREGWGRDEGGLREGCGRAEARSDGANLGIKLTSEGGRAGGGYWNPLINEGVPLHQNPHFPTTIVALTTAVSTAVRLSPAESEKDGEPRNQVPEEDLGMWGRFDPNSARHCRDGNHIRASRKAKTKRTSSWWPAVSLYKTTLSYDSSSLYETSPHCHWLTIWRLLAIWDWLTIWGCLSQWGCHSYEVASM